MWHRPAGAPRGPDGAKGPPFSGTYLEIVPNKCVPYDNDFESVQPSMPPEAAGKMIVTVFFDEWADGKTTLTIHTLFDTVAMKNAHVGFGHEEGVGSTIPHLEATARTIRFGLSES